MKLIELLDKIDKLKSELDAHGELSPEAKERLIQHIRFEWNYHSNAIEGNQLTLGETKSLLLYGLTSKGKPLKDILDMKGHEQALGYLFSIVNNDVLITESVIKKLHTLLLPDPFDDNPDILRGEYKQDPNYVILSSIGERLDFLEPEKVIPELNSLISWVNNAINPPKRKKKKYSIHPLVIAAEFHLQFVLIHPFDDGNGRLSQILMNLILMQCGFPPILIKVEHRAEYINALNKARNEGTEIFAEFLAERLVASLELYLKAAKGENIEDPDYLDKRVAVLSAKIAGKASGKLRRTNEEVLEALRNSVIPLFNNIAVVLTKIDRFFLDKHMMFNWRKFKLRENGDVIKLENDELVSANYRDRPNISDYPKEFIPVAKFYPPLLFMIEHNSDKSLLDELDSVSIEINWLRFVGTSKESDLDLTAKILVKFVLNTYITDINGFLIEKEYGEKFIQEECEELAKKLASSLLNKIEESIK